MIDFHDVTTYPPRLNVATFALGDVKLRDEIKSVEQQQQMLARDQQIVSGAPISGNLSVIRLFFHNRTRRAFQTNRKFAIHDSSPPDTIGRPQWSQEPRIKSRILNYGPPLNCRSDIVAHCRPFLIRATKDVWTSRTYHLLQSIGMNDGASSSVDRSRVSARAERMIYIWISTHQNNCSQQLRSR